MSNFTRKKTEIQDPPLTRLQRLTALPLSYRLAVMGVEPAEARREIEKYLGRTLACIPLLYVECRREYERGRRRAKRRAAQ